MDNDSNMNLDQFESWRQLIQQSIEDFFTILPRHIPETLDYSHDSLYVLGDWLLEGYPPIENFASESELNIHCGVMYYIGEVYRKYLDGYWNVHFAKLEPDYRYGEEPIIEGFFEDMAVCPLTVVLRTLKERRGEYAGGLLKTYRKMYKPESYLKT